MCNFRSEDDVVIGILTMGFFLIICIYGVVKLFFMWMSLFDATDNLVSTCILLCDI